MAGRLRKWHNWIDTSAGTLAAIIILLLVVATAMDSIGRSVFNHPFVGIFEISEFAMAWIGFLSIAYTQLQKGHISMNIIKGLMPDRPQAVFDFVIMGISLICVIYGGWVGLEDALESIRFGDKIMTGLITLPVGPPKLIIPIGCTLLALRFISQMVDDVLIFLGKMAPMETKNTDAKNEGETAK